jgi:hypothetical protein
VSARLSALGRGSVWRGGAGKIFLKNVALGSDGAETLVNSEHRPSRRADQIRALAVAGEKWAMAAVRFGIGYQACLKVRVGKGKTV